MVPEIPVKVNTQLTNFIKELIRIAIKGKLDIMLVKFYNTIQCRIN